MHTNLSQVVDYPPLPDPVVDFRCSIALQLLTSDSPVVLAAFEMLNSTSSFTDSPRFTAETSSRSVATLPRLCSTVGIDHTICSITHDLVLHF